MIRLKRKPTTKYSCSCCQRQTTKKALKLVGKRLFCPPCRVSCK